MLKQHLLSKNLHNLYKWSQLITNIIVFNFKVLFADNIIMAFNNKNLLKKLPFYSKEIKSEPKEFSNVKFLSKLPFFDKPIKAKIKQLSTEELLSEQPFYKQFIRKSRTEKLTNHELLQVLSYYHDVGILTKKGAFKKYVETYEVETIDNKSLSDLLFLSKNSIKSLFNDLLREKRGFEYILGTKITLKKRINDNETKCSTVYFNSITKTIIN